MYSREWNQQKGIKGNENLQIESELNNTGQAI